jgi:hypothetical protein
MTARRKTILCAFVLAAAAAVAGMAAAKYARPKTVIHVVTLYYKDGTTAEQKRQVVEGLEKMAGEVPGIHNIWLRPLAVQGVIAERQPDGSMKDRRLTDAFAIEFEDEAAWRAFSEHPAYKAWNAAFAPVRGQVRTQVLGN